MESASFKKVLNPKIFLSRLEGTQAEEVFYKYSPKFINNLILDKSGIATRKWISKVKSLKILKNFTASTLLKSKKRRKKMICLLLKILQPHHRSITNLEGFNPHIYKYFPQKVQYTLNTNEKRSWKGFFWLCNLQKLQILFEDPYQEHQNPLDKAINLSNMIERFIRHLQKSKGIGHLELALNTINQVTEQICQRVNESHDLLKRLTTLKIKMRIGQGSVIKSTEALFSNLFHYATKFELNHTQNYSVDYTRGHFHKFLNLQILMISFPTDRHFKPESNLALLEYLSHICKLNKLTELRLSFFWVSGRYGLDFFSFLSLPSALQKFMLVISEPKWDEIVQIRQDRSWEFQNPFEDHEILQKFYQQWEHLANLTSLNFRLENSKTGSIPNIAFIVPILQRISYLKELVFESIFTNHLSFPKQCLDWGFLWDKIQHLRTRLEILIVKEFAISMKSIELKSAEKLNLRRLELGKYLLIDESFSKLAKLLKGKERTMITPEQTLTIEKIIVKNENSFSKLLESFSSFPANIQAVMAADLRSLNKEELLRSLNNNIPKISKKKSLDLTLVNISKDVKREDVRTIKSLLVNAQAFCFLELVRRGGRTIYLFDSKYHDRFKDKTFPETKNTKEFNTWILENEISEGEDESDEYNERYFDNGEEDEEGEPFEGMEMELDELDNSGSEEYDDSIESDCDGDCSEDEVNDILEFE